jgi:hypothetical protein
VNLQARSCKLLEGLDDGVDVSEARRLDKGGSPHQLPSSVMKKSRFPKWTCAPRTQLKPWLASRALMRMSKHAKGPYLERQLSVF